MSGVEEAKGMIRSLIQSMNGGVGFALPRGWEFTLIGKISREDLEQAVQDLTTAGYLDADGALTQQGMDGWLSGG